MNIAVDVDGTLTDNPHGPWGEPWLAIIEVVKSAIAAGHSVTLWSAQGEAYARSFAHKYHICAHAYAAKPDLCVDDWPCLRPVGKLTVIPPEAFRDYLVKHDSL